MAEHIPYETRGVAPDFFVRYSYIPDNRGTKRLYQGIRCDWLYEDDPHSISMIWPQFIDAQGDVISDTEMPIADEGIATMWVLFDNAKSYHRPRIDVGVRGFFIVGPHKIARAVVTEVVGLRS